ncbi:hypothetical protein NDCJBJIB_02606 [Mannheimia haemolytica]
MRSMFKKFFGKNKSQSAVKSDTIFSIEQDNEGWLYPEKPLNYLIQNYDKNILGYFGNRYQ